VLSPSSYLQLKLKLKCRYDVVKTSVNGDSKFQQCLNLSGDKKKVATTSRFVSCDLWNDKHGLVSKAIVVFLQKAWGIRKHCIQAYKRGSKGGCTQAWHYFMLLLMI
jgi:hypothetical protein